jgi:phage terminase large subunit GpA-like protein
VYGWDKMNNSWLIHYGLLTSFDEVRSLVFNNEYQISGSDKVMKIWRAGIDTGGGVNQRDDDTFSQTETIYNFVRQHSQGRIFALKGRGGKGDGTRVKLSLLDKYPSGKVMVGGLSLYHLDVDAFKETFFWRLDQDEADSQQIWFHMGCESALFNSLTAEEKVRNKNGQWEWKRIRSRNDYLDCSVYAMALVDNQFAGGLKILGNKKMGIPELPLDVYPEHEVNTYMKTVQQRTNGGWLRRKR